MTTEATSFAQRSRKKLRFDHPDMHYYFSWIVGRQIYDGSDREECFTAAASSRDGDVASWQQAWEPLACRVKAEAEAALNRGERDAAGKAFLHACTYYRAALFMVGAQRTRLLYPLRQDARLFPARGCLV